MGEDKIRRQIFYFHGFDRRGPRFFNLWQKKEARAHVERFGGDLKIGDLERNSWSISSKRVQTEFHFMDWTQIVKSRFEQPFWVGMASMIKLGAIALRQGLFGQIRRADWAIGLLTLWAFLPMMVFLLALCAACFFGMVPVVAVAIVGGALFWALHRFDRYFGVYYALHIAWASRRMALRDDPDFEEFFATCLEQIKRANGDEVLLVGHSIGGALAMRAFKAASSDALLLTVGQSIPLVSFQAEAGDLRDDIEAVRQAERPWIDVSAGRDPLGFSGFDPSGGGATCVSAHFSRSFGEGILKALKWRGFEMHFLYFKAVEMSGAAWNWFEILADEPSVAARFDAEKTRSGKGERNGRF